MGENEDVRKLAFSLFVLLGAVALARAQDSKPATTPETAPAGEVKPPPVSLGELSVSLEGLVNRVRPAVVQIFSTGYVTADEAESGNTAALLSRQRSTGSGIVLSDDGFIVTNAHVVQGARRIQVRLTMARLRGRNATFEPEVKLLEAKLIGLDREMDVAVIKIDRTGLTHLPLGNSDAVRQGELVMAFGNPRGLEGSVSMGIVSSTSREIHPDDFLAYIQTDAPINPGNSGGPLIDAQGRVVGINTFILSESGGSEGLGFAIPSNIVSTVYTQLRKEGHVHRGKIGIYVQTITPAIAEGLGLTRDWGVLVGDVAPDGPADKAGVKVGDVVLTANGRTHAQCAAAGGLHLSLADEGQNHAASAAWEGRAQHGRAGDRQRGRSAAFRRHGESRGQSGAEARHSGHRNRQVSGRHAAGSAQLLWGGGGRRIQRHRPHQLEPDCSRATSSIP